MFGFDRPEDGSARRYKERLGGWLTIKKFLPRARHHLWWIFHNCFAHLLIGLVPWKPFFKLHDWTSHRMNPAGVVDKETEERRYFAQKVQQLVVESGKLRMNLDRLQEKYDLLLVERAQLPSVDLWVRYLREHTQMESELNYWKGKKSS